MCWSTPVLDDAAHGMVPDWDCQSLGVAYGVVYSCPILGPSQQMTGVLQRDERDGIEHKNKKTQNAPVPEQNKCQLTN
jgi:hypothetical protein